LNKRLNAQEALAFIQEGRGKRYDPQVTDTFVGLMGGVGESAGELAEEPDIELRPANLKNGMVLTRDLMDRDGLLLLARDYLLNDTLIEQLRNYERVNGYHITIYVRVGG
jgi:hypothetical protein